MMVGLDNALQYGGNTDPPNEHGFLRRIDVRRRIQLLVVALLVMVPALATGFTQTVHAATSSDGENAAWTPANTFTVAANYCGTPPGTISAPPCAPNTSQSYTLTNASTDSTCTTSFTATGTTVGNAGQTWTMTGGVTSTGLLSFTITGGGTVSGFTITTDTDNDAATDPEATSDGDEGTVASDGSASATAYDNYGRVYDFVFPAGSFVAGQDCQDLTLTGGQTFNATEGTQTTGIVATVSDPDRTNTSPVDFAATIDWGDGTTTSCTVPAGTNPCTYSGGALTGSPSTIQFVNCTQLSCGVQGTHTYADECPATSSFATASTGCATTATGYTITVSVTDADQIPTTSNPPSVTSNAVVADAAITTAGPASAQTCTAYSTCNVTLGSFTDANTGCNSENAGESITQNGGTGAHYLVTVNNSTTGVTFTEVGTSCVFNVMYAAGTFTTAGTPSYSFCVTDEGGTGPVCSTATTITVSYTANPHQPTSGYAPAQGSVIGQCQTTYTTSQTPQQDQHEVISNCTPYGWPGGGFNAAGGNSVGIHWTGTEGSYAHFLCSVPSIVTGKAYATYTSSELDVATTSQNGYNNIQEWCQVQTTDRPAATLLATISGLCINQSQNPPYDSVAGSNQFYVTETTGGLVTLHCNFRTYAP